MLFFLVAASLTIDYPQNGALFPPDIAAPTVLWRDTSSAASWQIDIAFAKGPPLRFTSAGPRARLGEIDRDTISTTNKLPEIDPRQHSWKPSPATWAVIKRRSQAQPATITITGRGSKAQVTIATSTDPVGAPIFYRDVPLMPTETEKGVIKPLAPYAVRLVKWRLRDIGQPSSRVVMEGLPVCANCHSFSRDGRTMGMDLDGLQGNRGRYFLAGVQPQTTVRNEDVMQWASDQGRLENAIRVGFMSQVSPAGDYVATTIDTPGSKSSNYYVANFTDYRFLQVFFPTRGLLAWAPRGSGLLTPLPGADDPTYVHYGAVWSPNGDYLVFARAKAQDPSPPNLTPAKHANDPNELQIQYDLCRIPFNNGRGGRAEPITGASANGKSNTFPKISPDGRWLVYVQSRNGQLMRPDSELYIVPAQGGAARRMRCNTPRMNSWHSFSPNGKWLVFSSKARSYYTQMYLTHVDDEGNDTPPVLIENSTAANRAVNLPEFVNLPPDRLTTIGGPALDYYRLFDRALYLQKQRRYDESARLWQSALDIAPGDADVRRRLGMTLLLAGRKAEALPHLNAAREATIKRTPLALAIHQLETNRDPAPVAVSATPTAQEHYYLALVSVRAKDTGAALKHLQQAVALNPDYVEAHQKLAEHTAQSAQALHHWREVIRLSPNNPTALRSAAWLLATNEALRNGPEAQTLAVRALLIANNARTLDTLAAAHAENGRFDDAVATARRALAIAHPELAPAIQQRIERYQSNQPWREK